MSGHTPGPWWSQVGASGAEDRVWSNEGFIADVWAPAGDLAANARLIAAAPAMLAALVEVDWLVDGEADINDHGGPNLAMKIQTAIAAALAKAGGQ